MMGFKTRCRQCVYSEKKATEEPCKECGEIQHRIYKYGSHFLPANKKTLKEGSIVEPNKVRQLGANVL